MAAQCQPLCIIYLKLVARKRGRQWFRLTTEKGSRNNGSSSRNIDKRFVSGLKMWKRLWSSELLSREQPRSRGAEQESRIANKSNTLSNIQASQLGALATALKESICCISPWLRHCCTCCSWSGNPNSCFHLTSTNSLLFPFPEGNKFSIRKQITAGHFCRVPCSGSNSNSSNGNSGIFDISCATIKTTATRHSRFRVSVCLAELQANGNGPTGKGLLGSQQVAHR